MTKSKSRSSVVKRVGKPLGVVKESKKASSSRSVKIVAPKPELICVRMPTTGLNDGEYSVTIPLAYMIKAYERPAAYFVFKFIGMKETK